MNLLSNCNKEVYTLCQNKNINVVFTIWNLCDTNMDSLIFWMFTVIIYAHHSLRTIDSWCRWGLIRRWCYWLYAYQILTGINASPIPCQQQRNGMAIRQSATLSWSQMFTVTFHLFYIKLIAHWHRSNLYWIVMSVSRQCTNARQFFTWRKKLTF